MANAAGSTAEEGDEKRPLTTSPMNSGQTFWFHDDGGAPILDGKRRPKRNPVRDFFTSPHLYYLIIIFLLLGLYAVQIGSQRHGSSHPAPVPSPDLKPLCGSSMEEALAMGCVFDVFVNGWLPAACYDRAVAEKSESNSTDLVPQATGRASFPVYWDKAMTKPATLEDVMRAAFKNGEDGHSVGFYIAWEYHRAHCLHLWRMAANAVERLAKGERSVGIFEQAASPEHAWHCSKVMIDGDTREPDQTDTIFPGIGRCVGLDDSWKDSYGWAGRWKPS